MKTLVIYAHPDHESHSKLTLDLVEEKLKSQKIDYEVLDLYKMNFNPVLSLDLYDEKINGLSKEIRDIQQKIIDSTELIFIYPIWWGTMPAMMKGFIDRTFTSGFAFKYGANGIPIKLLKGKHAKVFVSMEIGRAHV